ncbi:MAG: hypothetical protein KBD63_02420 [Bacteriovoracaceae bacterium]|nr:hypothetical protein [Bacteriovoracaceae bacterium]
MPALYVDTSELLIVGLLTDDDQWLDYQKFETKKNSVLIHQVIYQLCQKNNISIADITSIYQTAGPGSYTGIRLSSGLAEVFAWQGKESYSFYHFQIPYLLNHPKGIWLSYAFKNETFCFIWSAEKKEKQIIANEQLPHFLHQHKDYPFFTHFKTAHPLSLSVEMTETSQMLYENTGELWKLIRSKKLQEEPYYYRLIDQEFKKPSSLLQS